MGCRNDGWHFAVEAGILLLHLRHDLSELVAGHIHAINQRGDNVVSRLQLSAVPVSVMSVGARCTAMLRHPPSFYVKFFALTILFFLSSGGLTLYNKWIISIYGFDFPVWLVTITYTCAAVFSISTRLLASLPVRCCRTGCCRKLLRRAGVVPFHEDSLNFRKVAAIAGVGSMAAIEVASSNVSLLYLDVSYHIMLRAGIPVFVLLWAFALGLDKPSCRLAAVVLFICGGVAVLTYGENMTVNSAEDVGSEDADSDGTPDAIDEAKTFSWTGTAYVLLSCFCAGLKWALSELTLGGAKVGKALKASSGGGSCCLCSYSQVPRRRVHPSQPRARIEVAIEDDADNSNDDSNPRTTEATTTASTPQKAEIKAKETDNKHMAETPRRMSPFSLLSTTAFVSAISLLPIDFLSDEFQGLVLSQMHSTKHRLMNACFQV